MVVSGVTYAVLAGTQEDIVFGFKDGLNRNIISSQYIADAQVEFVSKVVLMMHKKLGIKDWHQFQSLLIQLHVLLSNFHFSLLLQFFRFKRSSN